MDLLEAQQRLTELEEPAVMTPENELAAFISQYGDRFSNNSALGQAILGELTANGMNVNAVTEDAVQTVIDTLRNQCNALLDAIRLDHNKNVEAIHQVQDKLNVIDEQVQGAVPSVAESVDLNGPEYTPVMDQPEAPVAAQEIPIAEPNMEVPQQEPMGAIMQEGVIPSEGMDYSMLEPAEESVQQELQPQQVVSDVRKKTNLKPCSNKNTTTTNYRVPSYILEIAQRGF